MDKTLEEVTLIIKGWYDDEKYKTTFEALTAYYHKHYSCESYIVTKDFICHLFLSEIIKYSLKHGASTDSFVDSLTGHNHSLSLLLSEKYDMYDIMTSFIILQNKDCFGIEEPYDVEI